MVAVETLAGAAVAQHDLATELWCAPADAEAAAMGEIGRGATARPRRNGATGCDASLALDGALVAAFERGVDRSHQLVDRNSTVDVEVSLALQPVLRPCAAGTEHDDGGDERQGSLPDSTSLAHRYFALNEYAGRHRRER